MNKIYTRLLNGYLNMSSRNQKSRSALNKTDKPVEVAYYKAVCFENLRK